MWKSRKIVTFARCPLAFQGQKYAGMIRKILLILICMVVAAGVDGQKQLRNTSILNYQRGDRSLLHFGFSLGVNYMDYRALLSGASPYRAETGKMSIGFSVGIISELRICEDLGLRFLPGLEFATRSLVFTNVEDEEDGRKYAYNESVYINLPLMLKYKARRINNFRPFLTAGGSFKYDFHNHDRLKPDKSVYFRSNQSDVFLETGAGCDFYLPYFKFGVELRFSLGLTDALVHRQDAENPGYENYTNAFKKLNARIFSVCFNFE